MAGRTAVVLRSLRDLQLELQPGHLLGARATGRARHRRRAGKLHAAWLG